MDAKKAMLQKNREVNADAGGRAGRTEGENDSPQMTQKAPATLVPQKTGPTIEVSNFVGVFNMPAKQKKYMYDRQVEVTKEQIQLLLELQEEEKLPVYTKDEDRDGEDDQYLEKKKEKKAHQLPEEEVERIFNKPNFKRFIRKGSGVIDHELSDTESLYDDLIERNDVGVDGEKTMINFSFNFTDESVKGYSVTGLVWCKTNADLLLAVYNTNDITEKYPSKMLVWSMKNKLKPTHSMHSEKKITRAIFHPRNESMIFAATYSGNIMQFTCGNDVGPQLKNFNAGENGEYHATPIYVLEYYFKESSEYLISISDDGKLCIWNVNFLYEPVVNTVLEVPKKDTSKIKPSNVHALNSTMIDQFSDEATLALCTQDSLLALYKVSSLFGTPDDISANYVQTEHHGPICAISYKSDPSHSFLQDMYLTASFDFDVSLLKATEHTSSIIKRFPLHMDYVTGVDWNPVHPALFASCDCNGSFFIFDLVTNPGYFSFSGDAGPATLLKWSPDGVKLAFGGINGAVAVWQMRKKYLKCDEDKLMASKYEFQ